MDMLLVAIVAMVLFVVARSFMQYEQDNLKENQSNSDKSSEVSQDKIQKDSVVENKQKSTIDASDVNNMQLEVGLVIALMARIAKSDGHVSMLEQELINFCFKDFSEPFENPEQIQEILKKIFNDEQNKDDGIDKLALQFYSINKHSYTKRMKVLQHLVNLAYVDRVLSSSEEKMLKEISDLFKINKEDFEHTIKTFHDFYLKNLDVLDIKEAYSILESNENNTMEEIKTMYRAMVKKYHPDLLHSRGFEDDYVQDCTRKLQQINQAYDCIKKHRK